MGERLVAEFDALVAHQVAKLTSPGVWWTGAQKTAIAREARAALHDKEGPGGLTEAAKDAARRVATESSTITHEDVIAYVHSGMRVEAYVELVAVVSRLVGLDSAAYGLGLDDPILPKASTGDPSRALAPEATKSNGWVPTVGPASLGSALTCAPGASELAGVVQRVLYIASSSATDLTASRDGLSRSQIEAVATRVSYLNDCQACLIGHSELLRLCLEESGHQPSNPLDSVSAGVGMSGVAGCEALFALTDAVVLRDSAEYPDARVRAEIELGRDGADRAAMVAANFQMTCRIANAVGLPVPETNRPL